MLSLYRIKTLRMSELKKDITELHEHGKKMPTYKINGECTQEYKDWAAENFILRKAFIENHGRERMTEYQLYTSLKGKLKNVGNYKNRGYFKLKNSKGNHRYGN